MLTTDGDANGREDVDIGLSGELSVPWIIRSVKTNVAMLMRTKTRAPPS